jgi:hypothetical protein
MKPSPRLACKRLLETFDIGAPPRPTNEYLVSVILAEGWCTAISEAQDLADKLANRCVTLLRRELSALNHLGRFSPFSFNSSSDELQGAAFIEPIDSSEAKTQKERRGRVKSYADALRGLTPRRFELLCAGVLSTLKAHELEVTPYVADEGIDFYCKLPLETHLFSADLYPSWKRQLTVWMIGQAKHYQGTVSTPEIRDLVGAAVLARGGVKINRNRFKMLKVRPCDPVFLLFFTTGRLSADAWELLLKSGVIGLDGEMLAAFLADREIGCSPSGFEPPLFETWVSTFAI